jgi:hypothetical protein
VPVDGVARLGRDGTDGVIAVVGDRGVVWWSKTADVAGVQLRTFDEVERDGINVILRSDSMSLEIRAGNEKYADAWTKLMRKFGARESR